MDDSKRHDNQEKKQEEERKDVDTGMPTTTKHWGNLPKAKQQLGQAQTQGQVSESA